MGVGVYGLVLVGMGSHICIRPYCSICLSGAALVMCDDGSDDIDLCANDHGEALLPSDTDDDDCLPSLLPDEDAECSGRVEYLISDCHSVEPQVRACFINACEALQSLPQSTRRSLAHHLGAEQPASSGHAVRAVARLFGMRPQIARSVWQAHRRAKKVVSASVGMSAVAVGVSEGASVGVSAVALIDDDDAHDPSTTSMKNAVRLVISSAAEGHAWLCFERDFMRYRLAGATLDVQSCSSRWAGDVTAIAALCLQEQQAAEFAEPVPGLGIPSDFALLADPVSVGDSVMSRHGDLLVICLAIVSARTGIVHFPLHSAEQMVIGGHSGEGLAAALLAAVQRHPAGWGIPHLRRRLSCIGGDGGLVLGGPAARHRSSGAAEKTWLHVHPSAKADITAAAAAAGTDHAAVGPATMEHAGADPAPTEDAVVGLAATEHAPMCTTWDPFHRVDIAMWRAIRANDGVLAIFEMSKQVDYWFGMSEGVHILKAVASQSGRRPFTVRAPGGTRKVVYLAGVPGSLLHNFRLVYDGLYARIAWAQAGHGSQTLKHLLEAGSSLARPQFVFTMWMADDIFRLIIQPFARRVQAHLEPCEIQSVQTRLTGQLESARRALHRLRHVAAVASMCRQHLAQGEIVRLFQAFGIGQLGKLFPTFFHHVGEVFGPQRAFDGVHLTVADDFDESRMMMLGPHCQCAANFDTWQRDWAQRLQCHQQGSQAQRRHAPGLAAPAVGLSAATRCHVRVGGREFSAPAWVAGSHAIATVKPEEVPLCDVLPRCREFPLGQTPPPGHDTRGMFRHNYPRCKVSRQDSLLHIELGKAFKDIDAFLESVAKELKDIFSGVGTNTSMSSLVSMAAQCWDWPRLMFERPTASDVTAFRSLAKLLKPCLQYTLFPTGIREFAGVPAEWPRDEDLCVQYMILCNRVKRAREASKTGDPNVPMIVRENAATWIHKPQVEVRSLFAGLIIRLTLGKVWKGSWGAAIAARSSARVSWFLLGGGRLHRVATTALIPADRKRMRGKQFLSDGLLPGSVVMVSAGVSAGHPIVGGHYVEVVRNLSCVSPRAVAASLDRHSWFSSPNSSGQHCWAAARLHHRCRLLMAPDAACEGIGSLMRLSWSSRRGSGDVAGRIADNVALASANCKCVGSSRDEALVTAVVDTLKATSSYKPRAFKHTTSYVDAMSEKSSMTGVSGDFNLGVPAMLHGITTVHARRAALQRGRSHGHVLPTEMEQGIRAAMDFSGRTRSLPTDVRQLHSRQRGATASIERAHQSRAHKKAWLDEECQEKWRAERKKILQADDPSDSDDASAKRPKTEGSAQA